MESIHDYLDNPALPLREKLFEILEKNLGENGMTLDNILDAIRRGVGGEVISELRNRFGNDNEGQMYLSNALPSEVFDVVINYKPKIN
ncbi:hypothetical protein HYV50_00975 [Candidatus Pacearchaeota archaeon]|nr:hypothetical protein [Candidatus Pacearchaeota archaeon]